ncbi:YlxR family protein [Corynebacterium renale]|uniref:YlxR family protein n=1 Tax=Corynebacterium renale TaxID=1724 RepID=UPI000DBE4463|nr:YlxR family protein [Corynebacterium renale]
MRKWWSNLPQVTNAPKSAHTLPQRTCIATRTTAPRSELLRLVSEPGETGRILADPKGVKPGRGAWITPNLATLELAIQRKAIQRALRVHGPLDTSHVHDYLAAHSLHPTTRAGVEEARGRQDRN